MMVFLVECGLLFFYWVVGNRKEFQLLRAKQQLKTACDKFQIALSKNAVVQQETRNLLAVLKQEKQDKTCVLSAAIRNHLSGLAHETERRGENGLFSASQALQLLSPEEIELYEKIGLLNIRISCVVAHNDSIRSIGTTLYNSYQKCVNHLACIELSNHVADISLTIEGLKFEGLEMVTSRLASDVEALLNTTSEVNATLDEESREVKSVMKGLSGHQKLGGRLMDDILRSMIPQQQGASESREKHLE